MLEYDGSAWHEDCFTCHGCDKPIGAEAFIPDKGNYYCVPCYEGRFAPQCSHCKKVKRASDSHFFFSCACLTEKKGAESGILLHRR